MSEVEERDAKITVAANLLSGGHSGPAFDMFYGALAEVERHHRGAGANAYPNWIESLEMLGSVCTAVAKLYRAQFRRIGK